MLRKQREGYRKGWWVVTGKGQEIRSPAITPPCPPGLGVQEAGSFSVLVGGGVENSGPRVLSGDTWPLLGVVPEQDLGMWGCSVAILTLLELPLLSNGGPPWGLVQSTKPCVGGVDCRFPDGETKDGVGHGVVSSCGSKYSGSKHWVPTCARLGAEHLPS